MAIKIIETKPVDDTKEYRLLDTDVNMLKRIKTTLNIIDAVRVARLLMPGIGLKEALDFVKEL